MALEYINLNPDTATSDEIIDAISNNEKVYDQISKKIKELKKIVPNETKGLKDEQKSNLIQDETTKKTDNSFEEEAQKYWTTIKKLEFSNLRNNLIDNLPPEEHYNYKKILLRIYAELRKEVILINKLFDENTKKEDVIAFSDDIKLLIEKVRIIEELVYFETEEIIEQQTEEKKENRLILLPSSDEKFRIVEDLSNIDIEYYDKFDKLLKSIHNGTLQKFSRFKNNDKLNGLCEVKDFKTRILFKRISDNIYVIIGAFIKKTDKNSEYKNTFITQYNLYKDQEENIIKNLNSKEFIEKQEQALETLYDMLQAKKKTSKMNK